MTAPERRHVATEAAVRKWNRAPAALCAQDRSERIRYGVYKSHLFAKARGRTLLVAAGTGNDFKFLPPGIDVVAIDFAPRMLERAAERLDESSAPISLQEADVTDLPFDDGHFATVLTSCTFCSVPDPVAGLREVRRVLAPAGQVLMFEHVRPSNAYLGLMMDLMNPVVRRVGPNINRRTAENVRAAGLRLTWEYNVFLDMVKLYEAERA